MRSLVKIGHKVVFGGGADGTEHYIEKFHDWRSQLGQR